MQRRLVEQPAAADMRPATRAIPQEWEPGPLGDPQSLHSFSQFHIAAITFFGNGNPS